MLYNYFLVGYNQSKHQQALVIGANSYTYEELFAKCNAVYSQIKEHSTTQTHTVAIICYHDVWDYAAILAVSAIGAAYLPVNSNYPSLYRNEILNDANPDIILHRGSVSLPANAKGIELTMQQGVNDAPYPIANSGNSYILYTSGTTGKPKGIAISHKQIRAFMDAMQGMFHFRSTDRFLQPYSLMFDVSVFCIFSAWAVGGTIIVPGQGNSAPLQIARSILEEKVTITSMVPTTLHYLRRYFNELRFNSVRLSFFSGDKLLHDLAAGWAEIIPNAGLYNCYGPTEATIVCTQYQWIRQTSEKEAVYNIVPIGKPFEGVSIQIIDIETEEPTEQIGELLLAGDQVIDNYPNSRSQEAFISVSGKKYYRTGDLVEINNNGNLIFHGRKDQQVKVDGYRVETSMIEAVLSEITKGPSAVLFFEQNMSERIVAIVESCELPEEVILEKMRQRLPYYMVPGKVSHVSLIPKNSNGKVDYQKLKEKHGQKNDKPA